MSRRQTRGKKVKKVMQIIGIIVAIILAISVGTLSSLILTMNIVPTKYLWIFYALGIVSIIFIFLLIFPKIKWQIKLVTSIFASLIIAVSIFGSLKVNDTRRFFQNIGAVDYEVDSYYVMVLKDSSYKKIEDIKGDTIGVFPNEFDTYKRALTMLDEKVKVEKKEYQDILQMAKDLLNGKVNAILISDAHEDVIEETYGSFKESVRILYTIEVKTELDKIDKDVKVTEHPFIVYISGIDTYGKITNRSRSDVNMVMVINPITHKVLLVNVPRDYYVQIHGTTGLKDKLTHAGVYGINKSVQTMEDILDIDINYYVRVNFNTLIDVVDVVGGIDIDSDTAFRPWTDGSCPIKKGKQHVNGKCALAFARERHAYLEGDIHRGQNQQQVITKLIEKMTTSSTLISKYSEILDSLDGSFQTNMKTNSIYSLIKLQLDEMPKWNVESIGVKGEGELTYTYSYPHQKLYVMIPDTSTVNKAKKKISEVLNQE